MLPEYLSQQRFLGGLAGPVSEPQAPRVRLAWSWESALALLPAACAAGQIGQAAEQILEPRGRTAGSTGQTAQPFQLTVNQGDQQEPQANDKRQQLKPQMNSIYSTAKRPAQNGGSPSSGCTHGTGGSRGQGVSACSSARCGGHQTSA